MTEGPGFDIKRKAPGLRQTAQSRNSKRSDDAREPYRLLTNGRTIYEYVLLSLRFSECQKHNVWIDHVKTWQTNYNFIKRGGRHTSKKWRKARRWCHLEADSRNDRSAEANSHHTHFLGPRRAERRKIKATLRCAKKLNVLRNLDTDVTT